MNKTAKYNPMRSVFSHPVFHTPLASLWDENFFGRDQSGSVPAVNISEDEKQWGIEVSAPGFSKEDFKVKLEDDVLTISATHKEENNDDAKNYRRREFRYGSFTRSFRLEKDAVNEENISAAYENGILRLSIPKREEAKKETSKEISIS